MNLRPEGTSHRVYDIVMSLKYQPVTLSYNPCLLKITNLAVDASLSAFFEAGQQIKLTYVLGSLTINCRLTAGAVLLMLANAGRAPPAAPTGVERDQMHVATRAS